MNILLALPSGNPGGFDAPLAAHFGHCDLYTLVNIEDGKDPEVSLLPNLPHVQGGCMAPVNHLAQAKVQALISGGMGLRPLMGFQQVGIKVFHGQGALTVRDAVDAFMAGRLPEFSQEYTCGGGMGA